MMSPHDNYMIFYVLVVNALVKFARRDLVNQLLISIALHMGRRMHMRASVVEA